jgi:hypothetical protein
MRTNFRLTEDFGNPTHRDGLEIMLLLAQGLGGALSEPGAIEIFERSDSGSWLEVIKLLGKLQKDKETAIYEAKKIAKVWEKLFGLNSLAEYEPELIAILEKARDKCIVYSKDPGSGVAYLIRANGEGHKIAKSILEKHKLGHLLPDKPVFLEIFYDEAGKEHCAGSSLLTNMIRWAYQPLPHMLAGAILAEYIFAHEYLSHLAPKNEHLDLAIREQWLVAALRGVMEEDGSRPYWKNQLWDPYRTDLEGHAVAIAKLTDAQASANDFSGYQGVERVLNALYYKDRALFWSLTVEILGQKSDEKLAERALRVARGLASKGIKAISSGKHMKLKELEESIGGPSSI